VAIRKGIIPSVVYHIFVFIFAIFMIYPVLWLFSSSLKDNSDIYVNALQLIPREFKFENYVNGWQGFGGYTFSTFFMNSAIVTVTATFGTIVSCSTVAYGFARVPFAASRFWFACMMVSMMLPEQVLTIPQYVFFSKMGWVNTFIPLILPSFFGGAFLTFMLMQFIRGLPKELDESAIIDGCGKLGVFVRIVLPLIVPAIVTASIFKFYWTWDDFFTPLLYMNKTQYYTASLALKFFSDPQASSDWGAMFAMSILSLVPVFVIFLVFQRFIIDGVATTGLKG